MDHVGKTIGAEKILDVHIIPSAYLRFAKWELSGILVWGDCFVVFVDVEELLEDVVAEEFVCFYFEMGFLLAFFLRCCAPKCFHFESYLRCVQIYLLSPVNFPINPITITRSVVTQHKIFVPQNKGCLLVSHFHLRQPMHVLIFTLSETLFH